MKKKVVAALLTTAMVLSMGACGTKDGGNTTDGGNEGGMEKAKDIEFEILVKSFQSTYWQAAVQGIEQACGELGVKANTNGPANESDIADQIQMIDDAIEKKPDGIGLAACDAKSVINSVNKALEKGIPVVCFDTGVEGVEEGAVKATIATDNCGSRCSCSREYVPCN